MSDLSLDDVTNMHDLLTKLNLLTLEQQFEDEQIDLDTLVRKFDNFQSDTVIDRIIFNLKKLEKQVQVYEF